MNYTIEELQANYEKFLSYIDRYITGERKDLLKNLYVEHKIGRASCRERV